MAGVKGLSGRKCMKDEEKRLRVIEKSWSIIEEFLNMPHIPIKSKVEVAAKLVVKDLPTHVDGMSMQQVVVMGEVKKYGEPLRFDIGEKIDA